MTNEVLITTFSVLLTLSHVIGGALVGRGVITLLRGVSGEGQSEAAVDDLRRSILRLLSPLLPALLAIFALVALTYWERSPLSTWIQLIAPFSTLLWVLWGHSTAKRVESGEMFEALFPLKTLTYSGLQLDGQQLERAAEWSKMSHDLNPRSLVKTALQALKDQQESEKVDIDLDLFLEILRDTFDELHDVLHRFPLGARITLADWMYEGERLGKLWQTGINQVEGGRGFVNPFTLLDQKMFWRWSSAQPNELFTAELSAWLHGGVYSLVTRRWIASKSDQQDPSTSPIQEQYSTSEAPPLWLLMTRKLTVPLWFYLVLSTAAISLSHGIYGAIIGALVGVFVFASLRKTFSIQRWRDHLTALGTGVSRRSPQLDQQLEESIAHIDAALAVFEREFDNQPAVATLTLLSETSYKIAYTHRRAEHTEAPLALCNVKPSDVALSAKLICDDLIAWRSEGGLLSMIVGAASKLGSSLTNLDERLMQSLIDWVEGADGGDERTDPPRSLNDRARAADRWIIESRENMGFMKAAAFQLAISYAESSLKKSLSEELKERLVPLYQGEISTSGEVDDVEGSVVNTRHRP